MSHKLPRSIASATLVVASLMWTTSANADIVDLKFNNGAFTHKANVAPKKFLEVCGKLVKGETIGWQFSGSAPSDFNIHYHVGKDVVYPEQRKGVAAAEGTLTVPLDQDFCWMWSNKSTQAIDIEVSLKQMKLVK